MVQLLRDELRAVEGTSPPLGLAVDRLQALSQRPFFAPTNDAEYAYQAHAVALAASAPPPSLPFLTSAAVFHSLNASLPPVSPLYPGVCDALFASAPPPPPTAVPVSAAAAASSEAAGVPPPSSLRGGSGAASSSSSSSHLAVDAAWRASLATELELERRRAADAEGRLLGDVQRLRAESAAQAARLAARTHQLEAVRRATHTRKRGAPTPSRRACGAPCATDSRALCVCVCRAGGGGGGGGGAG